MNNQKTILDILLEKNRLTQTEATRFDKSVSNTEIEKVLRQEELVSSEDIAQAYAAIYDLPFIRLENYAVSSEAFNLIPRELIEKYQIIAFEKDQNKIKVALGNPAELKNNPPAILVSLKEKKGVTADLYITTLEDIKTVLGRFTNQANPAEVKTLDHHINYSNTSHLKTIDLKSIKIPYEVISKFPIEISKKYHLVVFDNPTPSLIRVAVSDPLNTKVQEILDFVREKNEIAIQEFVASPDEISEAIKLYYQRPAVSQPRSIPVQAVPRPTPPPPPPVQAAPQAVVSVQPQPVPQVTQPQPVQPAPKPHFSPRPETTFNQPSVQEEEADAQAKAVIAPENDLDTFLGQEMKTVEQLKQIAQSGNVPQILAATVSLAAMMKASDIHIEPEETNLLMRFRVDGILKDIIKLPSEIQPAIISRIKILSRLKIDEARIPQDGRFDVRTHGHEIDLRVSTLPTVRGEKAALRLLDKSQNIFSLEDLGLAGRNLKLVEENITKPYGVILATGPTGSGKSTTLYAILKKIANPEVNVITLEDPVEYEIPGINQCQVKPKIGFSFAEGLRSVLRQDPNIIMVGEIRDAETAGMVTHSALTGHLVLTTLHTNDAAGALPRLINMGIEPFLITSSINAVIGQRLVRKICPKCRREAKIPEAILKEITESLKSFNLPQPYKFYEGAGCDACNQGFSGRIGIYEVLSMSDKIETLAIQRRPASEILAAAVAEGMVTMKQDGLIKAVKGVTTISEVLRVTTSG